MFVELQDPGPDPDTLLFVRVQILQAKKFRITMFFTVLLFLTFYT